MAITKVALLLVVVCGVLSIANAGDIGLNVRSRKLMSSWYWYCGELAQARADCVTTSHPFRIWKEEEGSCFTNSYALVYRHFSFAGADAVAVNGGNVAVANADAKAFGPCARAFGKTFALATDKGSVSSSVAEASSNGK